MSRREMARRIATSMDLASGCPLRYHRIVVKAGTNVLTRHSKNLDARVMESITEQVAQVIGMGAQVVLVTSGAIAAGRGAAPKVGSGKGIAASQMLAAIGQSRLMHAYQEFFSKRGIIVAQALLTGNDVDDRAGYLNVRNTLVGLMDQGIVPIVNENDVVDTAEIGDQRFGDNDTLSAIVANLVDADLLVMLTDTGGLFTADPTVDQSAQLITTVDAIDANIMALAADHRSGISRGGMRSKLEAAKRATAAGVTVVFGPGDNEEVIQAAACGRPIGTLFPTAVSAIESRKRWLLSGMTRKGAALVVDDGATHALVDQESSLLPAGVVEVKGEFVRGDVVEVLSRTGERLAYGIANYEAEALRAIAGVRSDGILAKLGYHHGDEAVHRNNLVTFRGTRA